MSDDDRRVDTAHGDDRPSKAVLDELLSMFEADDYTSGKDIDLTSPEVEALLSGGTSRPTPRADDEPDEPDQPDEPGDSDSDDGDDADADGEEHGDDRDEPETIVIVDEDVDAGTSDAVPGDASPPGIVVIEADDLPDVVAVGDSPDPAVAAGREGRNPVFIDDDSKSFEVVGSAEAARASGIEPKLRERRDAVRKAHGRRRLRWVALAVFVVLVVVAGLAVLGSSWFSIKEVDVGGAVYSRDELAPIIADIEGTPVLRLDTGGYEDRIREIPWVEDVRVTTHFPDRAKIEVRERVPVATFAGGDGRFRVIDREGRVLDMVDGQPADFLFVRSDEPPNTGLSDYAPPGFVGAASIATAFTPSVAPLVEVVEVANDGSDLRLALTGGTEVRLGDTQNLADKLVRLETVIDGRVGALPARIDVATSDVTTSESG